MTATLLERAPAGGGADFLYVDLDLVDESPLNPRKYFDKEALAELAASMKEHGILTPLLARPAANGRYELGAGHRRYRAAKAAGLTQVPMLIRTMSDLQLLEVLTIENLQREDVTPLEEAAGYHALLDTKTYDVVRLADRVGKSKEYIYGRLNLLKLAPEAKKALETERIKPSHAALLVPLAPEAQKEVLQEAFRHTAKGEAPSVRDFDHQIEQTVRKQKYEAGIEEAMAQAAKDHPDAKKIYRLMAYSYSNEPGTLSGREWKAVPKDTDGALVGVLIPAHQHDPTKPKVVYFERVKESAQRSYSGPTEAQWGEREKRQKERDRRKAAGGVAVRQAFAAAAKQLDARPFLAAVVETLMLRCYESSGVTDAFCEFIGAKPVGQGMHFRLNKGVRGRIQKLSADELKAAALFLIAQPHKGGSYDSEQYEVTLQLARPLKIDVEGIAKKAGQEAEDAFKAKSQTSATAKLRKAPKAKKKRAGDVAAARKKKHASARGSK